MFLGIHSARRRILFSVWGFCHETTHSTARKQSEFRRKYFPKYCVRRRVDKTSGKLGEGGKHSVWEFTTRHSDALSLAAVSVALTPVSLNENLSTEGWLGGSVS